MTVFTSSQPPFPHTPPPPSPQICIEQHCSPPQPAMWSEAPVDVEQEAKPSIQLIYVCVCFVCVCVCWGGVWQGGILVCSLPPASAPLGPDTLGLLHCTYSAPSNTPGRFIYTALYLGNSPTELCRAPLTGSFHYPPPPNTHTRARSHPHIHTCTHASTHACTYKHVRTQINTQNTQISP